MRQRRIIMGTLLKFVPGGKGSNKKADGLSAEVIGLWVYEIDAAISRYRSLEASRLELGLSPSSFLQVEQQEPVEPWPSPGS